MFPTLDSLRNARALLKTLPARVIATVATLTIAKLTDQIRQERRVSAQLRAMLVELDRHRPGKVDASLLTMTECAAFSRIAHRLQASGLGSPMGFLSSVSFLSLQYVEDAKTLDPEKTLEGFVAWLKLRTRASLGAVPCDGNHGGGECLDPQCWHRCALCIMVHEEERCPVALAQPEQPAPEAVGSACLDCKEPGGRHTADCALRMDFDTNPPPDAVPTAKS